MRFRIKNTIPTPTSMRAKEPGSGAAKVNVPSSARVGDLLMTPTDSTSPVVVSSIPKSTGRTPDSYAVQSYASDGLSPDASVITNKVESYVTSTVTGAGNDTSGAVGK